MSQNTPIWFEKIITNEVNNLVETLLDTDDVHYELIINRINLCGIDLCHVNIEIFKKNLITFYAKQINRLIEKIEYFKCEIAADKYEDEFRIFCYGTS